MPSKFNSFQEFYPYYLAEHTTKKCKWLHFVGSSFVILLLIFSLATRQFRLLLLLPVIGYGFAWIGHFVFEKNKPATFKHPLYSFIGDWVMWWQMLTGKKL